MYDTFIDEHLQHKYSWESKADYENPEAISELDVRRLNRNEGYEMLYFIRSLARTWGWKAPLTRSCRRLEKIIKTELPKNVELYSEIKEWLERNYEKL